MSDDALTASDVFAAVHKVLEDREPKIRARMEEQMDARDALIDQKLETLAVRVGAETAAKIDALWKNGHGLGGVNTSLALLASKNDEVMKRLDGIAKSGCGAHPVPVPAVFGRRRPVEERTANDDENGDGFRVASRITPTWAKWLQSIHPVVYLLVVLALFNAVLIYSVRATPEEIRNLREINAIIRNLPATAPTPALDNDR